MRHHIFIVLVCLISVSKAFPYVQKLSLADEWNSYYQADPQGEGSYSYGYDLEDPATGNLQYKSEERYTNGTVRGSYGLLEPDGNLKIVTYIADEFGYRATVEDSSKTSARHHPPLSARPAGQDRELPAHPAPQSRPFLQSVHELRTPPKYLNTFSYPILTKNLYNNLQ